MRYKVVLHESVKMVLGGVVALLGLFIARSNAPLISTQDIGLGIFAISVGYVLWLVKRHFDRTLGH